MNRRIPNGAWCLFKMSPGGTRYGKVVLAQHRSIEDPELGGSYTVKVYSSEKERAGEDGGWRHSRITLSPDSRDSSFRPIELEGEGSGVVVVAELRTVIE